MARDGTNIGDVTWGAERGCTFSAKNKAERIRPEVYRESHFHHVHRRKMKRWRSSGAEKRHGMYTKGLYSRSGHWTIL